MNEGLIPKRYAKALYKFAVERGADAGLYRLMGNLSHSFADNPALNRTIDNPFVEDAKKVELLKTAAHVDENVPATAMKAVSEVDAEVFADFLKLLVENRRLPLAWAASRAYCDIYRKENSIYRVKVVSAKPLDKQEQQRLTKFITAHLDGGTSEMTFATDPDIIGGFTVDIDNERLDASVKNELKQLRLKLLKQA